MKFNNKRWVTYAFPDVIDYQEGPGILAKDFKKNGVPLIRLAGMEDGISLLTGCNYLDQELVKNKYNHFRLKIGDVILSTSATLGKTSVVDEEAEDAIVYTGLIRMRPKGKTLYSSFIKYLLQSPSFVKQIESMGVGSVMKHFGPTHLKKIFVKIPSWEEQKLISDLFPSIETMIDRVDSQEKRMRSLQQSLINGLLHKKPVFGKLLNAGNTTQTTFGEIAECDKRYPEHTNDINRFIGLENIVPGNFQLQGWGDISNGTTFTKRFVRGDILFGKRRAYLKKIAIADFDGICSGDILVIRSKGDRMLQGLLPFYFASDAFIQYAINTSAGSLSPRTKWKDLANMGVSIPDNNEQEIILMVLQSSQSTINQLKRLKGVANSLKQILLNEILN